MAEADQPGLQMHAYDPGRLMLRYDSAEGHKNRLARRTAERSDRRSFPDRLLSAALLLPDP